MATPSFVKRMRNKSGSKATFKLTNRVKPVTLKVRTVEWTGTEYVLVGQDFSNISKRGAPTRRIKVSNIVRPVRYNA